MKNSELYYCLFSDSFTNIKFRRKVVEARDQNIRQGVASYAGHGASIDNIQNIYFQELAVLE